MRAAIDRLWADDQPEQNTNTSGELHVNFRLGTNGVDGQILALYAAGPLILLAFNALKGGPEIAINPFGPPLQPTWENFSEAWEHGRFGTTLQNSLKLVALVVPGVLLVGFPAAYALARHHSRGVDALVTYLLIASTIPVQLYLLPLFVFFSRTGLMNSLPALAVIYIAKFSPLATFLLRAFLLKTPLELEDAARLDGASEFQMLTRILVPICAPVLLTVALITGLMVWNEFALAITFIQERELKPVSTSLFAFSRHWNPAPSRSFHMGRGSVK